MAVKTKTQFGVINITNEAIASVTADAVLQCYGVVGIAKKSALHEKLSEILKDKAFSQGVFVKQDRKVVEIDIYVFVSYDVKITEVLCEIQKRVKYLIEKTFEIKVKKVNVFAQGIKRID